MDGMELKGDYLPRIPGGATLEQTQNALNDIINRLNGQLQFQQFSDDATKVLKLGQLPNGGTGFEVVDANGVGLALFGKYPDGSIALKVAKPNKEVTTAPDTDLVFNSNQNVFKIVDSFVMNVSLPVSAVSQYKVTTRAHGLSFKPAYLAFITPDPFFATLVSTLSGLNPNPCVIYQEPATTGNLGVLLNSVVSADDTNVYFTVDFGLATASVLKFSAKVYLLQETAN